MSDIESFIERHGLEWHATSLAKTMRQYHSMGEVWDNVDPDSLVYIATCPHVLSQEELISFGVWAIRQIPGWECKDKDRALALIEKHAASDLTPEADEDRTTANRIAGMLGEDAVPCTEPGGASFARLALQCLSNAARVNHSREYTIPPAGAVRDSLSRTRGALGLGEIPKHFAAWLRAYTTPHLFVTFQHCSTLVSGWRIQAPPGKVQALQTQSLTAPLPPKDGASLDVHKEERVSLEEAVVQYNKAREAVERAGQELHLTAFPRIQECRTVEACDALRSMLPLAGVEADRLRNLVTQRRHLLKREGGTNA